MSRITADLPNAHNDTGRTAFCGPYVLSAITGFGIARVEGVIREKRGRPAASKDIVKGTFPAEVKEALAVFGYRMELRESFLDRAHKERPSLWTWMQKPRNAWSYYLLGINKRKAGHWILVKGVKICDTYTEGQWKFVVDGPHRGCRIMEVFEVRRAL